MRLKSLSGLQYKKAGSESKSRGISLVELMVVIAVLGILAGGTVYIAKNQTINAQTVDGLSQMDSLESAARVFYSTYNCLPGDCIQSSFSGLTVTPNSGNMDSVVNNWYFTSAAPSAGFAGAEDVNAIQQLVATGFLTSIPNGSITSTSSTTDLGTTTPKYGLPNVTYLTASGVVSANNLYTAYNNYYIRGKSPNIFYTVRSVHSNILTSMTGVQNVAAAVTSAATSVNFVLSAVATFANATNMTMDNTSYNVMAGMDKKIDGDTPTAGSMQAILIGAAQGGTGTGPAVNSFVFMPVFKTATAAAAAVSAVTNSTSNLNGITYITATGTAGLIYSGFTVSSVTSWSNLTSASFNSAAISNVGVLSATNVVTSVDLVRPIYGLN